MLSLITALLAVGLLAPSAVRPATPVRVAGATAVASQDRRARPVRRDYGRRGRGIGTAYRRAGRSAARGGAGFGKGVVRGRPVRATKHLGKGAGGFGKHSGVGTARVGKKIGRGVKRVF